MFPINYAIAFFGLLIGSLFDLKTREIPDWLNFSMIGAGFGFGIIFSILYGTWSYVIYSVTGFIIALILSLIFYRAGQWGGGDAKALMGLGALFGFGINGDIPLFMILVLNIFIVGAFYGLIWSIILTIKHRKVFKLEFQRIIHDKKMMRIRIVIIALCTIGIIMFFNVELRLKPVVLGITAFVFFTFYFFVYSKAVEKSCMEKKTAINKLTEGDWIVKDVYKKKTEKTSPYTYLMTHYNQKVKMNWKLIVYGGIISFLKEDNAKKHKKIYVDMERKHFMQVKKRWENTYNTFLDRLMRNLQKKGFFKHKYTKNDKKEIHRILQLKIPKTRKEKKVFELMNNYGYFTDKELICGPKDGDGLSKEQLKQLKIAKIKEVLIKEGIPFLPSFFIALILTLLVGNWLMWVI